MKKGNYEDIMKKRSKLTLATVSVLALFSLAACGRSNSDPESSSTETSGSVKIGQDGSVEARS